MRNMRVLMRPLLRIGTAPWRSPAMPYTMKPKTSAEMIWNGVMAVIWVFRGGVGAAGRVNR
jgi:hypothetical protein